MTTTAPTWRPIRFRQLVGYAAILGTLPYLTLKTLWLTGTTVGLTDPGFAHATSLLVLNAVTAGMDAVVIVVALALTHDWGRRLPAWLVLTPLWIGTGLLAPIVVVAPITAAVSLVAGPSGPGGNALPLEPWVQPLVYGGFAWQGVTLLLAFVLYAKVRWAHLFTARVGDGQRGATHVVQAPLVIGAGVLAVAAGLTQLAWSLGAADGSVSNGISLFAFGATCVLGALGALTVVLRWRPTLPLWLPLTAAWLGAGAMFTWGLWSLVNVLGDTAVRGGGAVVAENFVSLAKLLAGLLLGVGTLLRIADRHTA